MKHKAEIKQAPLSYEYDATVDALYVYLRPGLTFAKTIQLDDECGTNVDVDAAGAPIGYEALSVASVPGRTWLLATLARRVPLLDDFEMGFLAYLSAQDWNAIWAPSEGPED